jgi:hypothetical protein
LAEIINEAAIYRSFCGHWYNLDKQFIITVRITAIKVNKNHLVFLNFLPRNGSKCISRITRRVIDSKFFYETVKVIFLAHKYNALDVLSAGTIA